MELDDLGGHNDPIVRPSVEPDIAEVMNMINGMERAGRDRIRAELARDLIVLSPDNAASNSSDGSAAGPAPNTTALLEGTREKLETVKIVAKAERLADKTAGGTFKVAYNKVSAYFYLYMLTSSYRKSFCSQMV